MKICSISPLLLTCLLTLALSGCRDAPGRPKLAAQILRPEQVLDFPVLYKKNCAGCHGVNGSNGAAISLSNAVYLAAAGEDTIQHKTANGVPGTLMPAFARSNGGMLTDQQVAILAHGMVEAWGRPMTLNGQIPPAYASASAGDPIAGFRAFTTFCGRCHGAQGAGSSSKSSVLPSSEANGSIVDPAYLALVSDQSLRSTIIAGKPGEHMPDWHSDATGSSARTMTDQEITDTVAWLASQRIATPGQPYRQHE